MLRFSFFILFLLTGFALSAQKKDKANLPPRGERLMNGRQLNDTLGSKFDTEKTFEYDEKTHFTDYKRISHLGDSSVIDTTLSYQKDIILNHLRKDNFDRLAFHNLGQSYSNLSYDFSATRLLPKMGMREKHYDFTEVADVSYYRVPTPTSILFFKSGIQQGQVLHSLLTTNISPQHNISILYKGLRSLGAYRSALASRQNLQLTSSYQSKNKAYQSKIHFVSHNLMNEENGGLTNASIDYFTTNNAEFTDRGRLETNYTDAESRLKTRRFYIQNSYNLWQDKDSISQQYSFLQLGHKMVYTKKYYFFNQDKNHDVIGNSYTAKIADSTHYKSLDNVLYTQLKSPYILGKLGAQVQYSSFNYGGNNILFLDHQILPEKLKGNTISFEADWQTKLKNISLTSSAGLLLNGDLKGNYFKGVAGYTKDSVFTAKATLSIQSHSPNFNFLWYQSDYVDYNWHTDFKNENTRYLSVSLQSKKWLDAEASITQKNFYTYFDQSSKPQQYLDLLNYIKVKVHRSTRYKKFTLDNTIQYQRVATGRDVMHVPEILTRNSFYFSDYVFKGNPLFLQTGITLKYFTKYKADEFDPVLNEFIVQNTTQIGGYPILDFFVNGQIRRTRLFVKAENIGSFWQHNHFVTPTHIYRDFTIRFGVVWNFFI